MFFFVFLPELSIVAICVKGYTMLPFSYTPWRRHQFQFNQRGNDCRWDGHLPETYALDCVQKPKTKVKVKVKVKFGEPDQCVHCYCCFWCANAIRAREKCPHHFHLSTKDLDGDRVRCRFADADQGECVSCQRHSFIELDEVSGRPSSTRWAHKAFVRCRCTSPNWSYSRFLSWTERCHVSRSEITQAQRQADAVSKRALLFETSHPCI